MQRPLVKVIQLRTLGLDEHYRSYIIEQSESPSEYLLSLSDLSDYSVLHIHYSFAQSNDFAYVCLKWNIEDVDNGLFFE